MLAFAHLSGRPPDAKRDEPDPIEEVQRQALQVLGEKLKEYRGTIQASQQPRASRQPICRGNVVFPFRYPIAMLKPFLAG
jgi:hypothetical protein